MHIRLIINKAVILTALGITLSACSNGKVTHHIEFINKTPVKFKCYGYKNQIFGTTFEIELASRRSAHTSSGEARMSSQTSWACKPITDNGYINYSLSSKINPEEAQSIVVSIQPMTTNT